MSKEERKQVEPTNNKPENGLTADMRALFRVSTVSAKSWT